jgi:hypothetical protein
MDTEELQDLVDLEEWSRDNAHQPPPRCRRYRILIDRQRFEVSDSAMRGEEILALVGKASAEWVLAQKLRGGRREVIQPEQLVDFRTPGIERFETVERQVQAGAPVPLLDEDREFLDSLGLRWEFVTEGSTRAVVISGVQVPAAYRPSPIDIMIQVPPNYPAAPLDMFWCSPALTRVDQRAIPQLVVQAFAGRSWQRWSRHRSGATRWRAGIDNLATHFLLVQAVLEAEAA